MLQHLDAPYNALLHPGHLLPAKRVAARQLIRPRLLDQERAARFHGDLEHQCSTARKVTKHSTVMDEAAVGIEQYTTRTTGFTGILKHR